MFPLTSILFQLTSGSPSKNYILLAKKENLLKRQNSYFKLSSFIKTLVYSILCFLSPLLLYQTAHPYFLLPVGWPTSSNISSSHVHLQGPRRPRPTSPSSSNSLHQSMVATTNDQVPDPSMVPSGNGNAQSQIRAN